MLNYFIILKILKNTKNIKNTKNSIAVSKIVGTLQWFTEHSS